MEIDCACSIDTRDESTWGQGGDCEYGSMTAFESGVGDGGTCCILHDFWVPSIRYNGVALCIIQSDPRHRVLHPVSFHPPTWDPLEFTLGVRVWYMLHDREYRNPTSSHVLLLHPIFSPSAYFPSLSHL
jgi:hypothetical protein